MRNRDRALVATVILVVVVLGSFVTHVPRVEASDQAASIVSVELVGDADTRFEIDGRRYRGPVTFTRHADGLAFTERASIDQYLEGIAEMPFLWNQEALAAQAVAARTYLTYRLNGGRAGDAARYEFDICATNRCQVYRGVQYVEGDSGDRWRFAVQSTRNQLVLYNGRPIEAVYGSMVGSRSRANQDVWASSPVPYLQAVDSPEIGRAPYARWTVELGAEQFVQILRADGLDVGGALHGLVVDDPVEGEGRTTITVTTDGGTDSILAPALKGTFNRHGDELYPGALPARRTDGGHLPEPLLSYTFDIEHVSVAHRGIDLVLPDEDRIDRDQVVISGEGWGHGVGMSQWGARIMADDGATHTEILGHYYTGTETVRSDGLVPEEVIVGLDWERFEFEVTVDGTAILRVNGVPAGAVSEGTWIVRTSRSGILVFPLDGPHPFGALSERPWPR